MRSRLGFGLLVFGIVAALALPLALNTSRRSTTAPQSPAWLVALARQQALAANDPHPTSGHFVLSTRQAANMLDSGDLVETDQPAYLVVLTGSFVANSAPAGTPLPTGTVLSLVVDAATHDVLDLGIGNRVPDLASLGAVGDLPL